MKHELFRKLHIPLAHVEAGLRSYFKRMPVEQNRVLTDHLSDWLFCPTETAVSNLAREGIIENVYHVGDIMLDASLFYRELIKREQGNGVYRLDSVEGLEAGVLSKKYLLAMVHRAENTDDPQKLGSIAGALNEMSLPVVLPLHPRTKKTEQTEWVETERSGWNVLAGTDKERVLRAVEQIARPENHPGFYGTGDAGGGMLGILEQL